MDTRSLTRLAFAAAAFFMAAAPAAMAEDDCKSAVVAEGKPASLRDLGAYPNSLLAWRSAVKEKYGSEYNSWRYAKDAKVDCDAEGQASGSASAPQSPARTCCTRCSTARRKQPRATARPSRSAPTARPRRTTRPPRRKSISGWEIDTSQEIRQGMGEVGQRRRHRHRLPQGRRRPAVHRRRHALQEVALGVAHGTKKAAADSLGRRFSLLQFVGSLDDVDLGRQVRRDLEANFLLTNCGLCPNLHSFLLWRYNGGPAGPPVPITILIAARFDKQKSQSRDRYYKKSLSTR